MYDSGKNPTFSKLKSTINGEYLITEQGGYDTSCANPRTCHKPAWSKDARGNQTDYTYDATHGGLPTVTAPADVNGIRPKTTYTYEQRQAQYYVGSTLVSGDPVWVVTRISTCRTTASCINTAVRAAYGSHVRHRQCASGKSRYREGLTNAVLQTITRTFTSAGDHKSEDGPLAGTTDTTRHYYDNMRRQRPRFASECGPGGALTGLALEAKIG